MKQSLTRRNFILGSITGLGLLLVGCSGSGKAPSTRPLTAEELEQVKREDKQIEDEETTGGSGQKPTKNSR
ncbi:MAG: hypothetical protein N2039_09700 [Gemmataceae bacterium]|nr:hypothetical protein [Gemmataceae bacterium]